MFVRCLIIAFMMDNDISYKVNTYFWTSEDKSIKMKYPSNFFFFLMKHNILMWSLWFN